MKVWKGSSRDSKSFERNDSRDSTRESELRDWFPTLITDDNAEQMLLSCVRQAIMVWHTSAVTDVACLVMVGWQMRGLLCSCKFKCHHHITLAVKFCTI